MTLEQGYLVISIYSKLVSIFLYFDCDNKCELITKKGKKCGIDADFPIFGTMTTAQTTRLACASAPFTSRNGSIFHLGSLLTKLFPFVFH